MTMITVQGLTKRYGDRTVVDDVSFAVEEGETFGLLGPNGAGKTTIVETVAGLRRPDAGTVRVAGLDPVADADAVKEVLGVQLQESRFPDRLRVAEALELFASFYRSPAPWRELMAELGLEDQRNTPFAKLSGGQRQRLSIAVALLGRPRVAILDELTTGLDPNARRQTWGLVERLKGRGVTVVLVTHFMEEAERLADRVALVDAGRLVALDTPAGLVASAVAPQVMRFRPGAPLELEELRGLPGVRSVARDGERVVVSGGGEVVHAVTSLLATRQVIAHELRVEQATLDDAFIALTGRRLEPAAATEA
ncbi:MAG TPA: ABC transporter ATP-binding protein [Trueperaceae bacterium]|jgi:ABC-2 type transport system ATP-binding protein